MGVYIDMEMPKDGSCIQIVIDDDGEVYPSIENCIFKIGCIAKAVPVPPHGELKDADAIERNLLKMQQAQTGPCSHGVRKSRAVLRDAPTIIPAEQAEEGILCITRNS